MTFPRGDVFVDGCSVPISQVKLNKLPYTLTQHYLYVCMYLHI